MTFTKAEQADARRAFVDECRQKAWAAACHADWIARSLDELMEQYKKLQEQDRTLEADIKELQSAIDSHTVENRNKRKALQEKRNTLGPQMQAIAGNAQQGQKALEQLYAGVETSLALAKHAETWEWKEVENGQEASGKSKNASTGERTDEDQGSV